MRNTAFIVEANNTIVEAIDRSVIYDPTMEDVTAPSPAPTPAPTPEPQPEPEPESPACATLDHPLVTSVEASSDDGHCPENTLDSSLDPESRWSGKGLGETLTLEFAQPLTLSCINLAFYRGNLRDAELKVDVAGSTGIWRSAVSRQITVQRTLDVQRYDFSASDVRQVRITGYGNTENDWNSITEVSFDGCIGVETPAPEPEPMPEPSPEPDTTDDLRDRLQQRRDELRERLQQRRENLRSRLQNR